MDVTKLSEGVSPGKFRILPIQLIVCEGIEDVVHHYVSRDHLLEQRYRFATATDGGEHILPPGSFLLGLSSIHWREAWKYG
ncbi:MAG: nitroreductase, partial [bacterium]|nr:nitroreductase [bacterium]